MAAPLQAQRLFLFLTASTSTSTSSSSSLTTRPRRRTTAAPCRAGLRLPSGVQTTTTSASSSIPCDGGMKLDWIDVTTSTVASSPRTDRNTTAAVDMLRLVAEAAADRAEMHDIIGRQRDNWNHLLLHSTNSLTLSASVMAALAPSATSTTAGALAASAGVLLATAAVTMAAVNKIQPSQLAEEQRNATRLWRQLERSIRATLHQQQVVITEADVQDAMDRVLALDAAYPLPLLPGMLEKFPKAVEPARWWPRRRPTKTSNSNRSRSFGSSRRGGVVTTTTGNDNGWSPELEEEMRGLLRVLRAKDEHQYLTVGKLVLRLNRGLAVAGPALAGTAAVAAAFIGATNGDGGSAASWASGAAAVCGAMAAAVNTVEHGGQLGMVFELLRNCAGFYRKLQEDIEAALGEGDVERRENGDVFRTKVALLLGRDADELRQFRRLASKSVKDEDIRDYAGKLF